MVSDPANVIVRESRSDRRRDHTSKVRPWTGAAVRAMPHGLAREPSRPIGWPCGMSVISPDDLRRRSTYDVRITPGAIPRLRNTEGTDVGRIFLKEPRVHIGVWQVDR